MPSKKAKSGVRTSNGSGLSKRVEKSRVRRKNYALDLRIHTPSSLGYIPVEGIETAPALVRLAKVKGLDVIAVTDYHSGAFIDEMLEAAKSSPVSVIPGVIIRCNLYGCDDVILSVLFPEDCGTAHINSFLRSLSVPDSEFGSRDFVVPILFEEVLRAIDTFRGVAIPSRMDKTPHRKAVIPVLVEQYGFRAFDLAYYPESTKIFRDLWPKEDFELLSFSKANALAQVGSRRSEVKLIAPGFEGVREMASLAVR